MQLVCLIGQPFLLLLDSHASICAAYSPLVYATLLLQSLHKSRFLPAKFINQFLFSASYRLNRCRARIDSITSCTYGVYATDVANKQYWLFWLRWLPFCFCSHMLSLTHLWQYIVCHFFVFHFSIGSYEILIFGMSLLNYLSDRVNSGSILPGRWVQHLPTVWCVLYLVKVDNSDR